MADKSSSRTPSHTSTHEEIREGAVYAIHDPFDNTVTGYIKPVKTPPSGEVPVLSTASSTREVIGEIDADLKAVENTIWQATGSALLAGERCKKSDAEVIRSSLCVAGNQVAAVRDGLRGIASAIRRIGPETCDRPGDIFITATLGTGEWYCGGCGANQDEPKCRYRKAG